MQLRKWTRRDDELRLCENQSCDRSGVRLYVAPPPGLVIPVGYIAVERCDCCNKLKDDMAAAKLAGTAARWLGDATTVGGSVAICRPHNSLRLVHTRHLSECCRAELRHDRLGMNLSLFRCTKCNVTYVPMTATEIDYADRLKVVEADTYEKFVQRTLGTLPRRLLSSLKRQSAMELRLEGKEPLQVSETLVASLLTSLVPREQWEREQLEKQPLAVVEDKDAVFVVDRRKSPDTQELLRILPRDVVDERERKLLAMLVLEAVTRLRAGVANWATLEPADNNDCDEEEEEEDFDEIVDQESEEVEEDDLEDCDDEEEEEEDDLDEDEDERPRKRPRPFKKR